MKHGKKYQDSAKTIERGNLYDVCLLYTSLVVVELAQRLDLPDVGRGDGVAVPQDGALDLDPIEEFLDDGLAPPILAQRELQGGEQFALAVHLADPHRGARVGGLDKDLSLIHI